MSAKTNVILILINWSKMMKTEIIPTHIKQINIGDTVMVNGKIKTVSHTSFSGDGFMGLTLFGDSYHLGSKLVDKVIIYRKVSGEWVVA